MWFTILVTVSLLTTLICCIVKFGRKERDCREGIGLAIVGSSIVLVIWFGLWTSIYVFSMKMVAQMDAFCRHTKGAYEYAITATEEIEIKALKKIEGSENPSMQMFDSGGFAYFKLAPVASERIMEFRNKIERYNIALESYKRWNSFWFTKGFIADVPSDLKPINFGES